jgi:hypothetical protein
MMRALAIVVLLGAASPTPAIQPRPNAIGSDTFTAGEAARDARCVARAERLRHHGHHDHEHHHQQHDDVIVHSQGFVCLDGRAVTLDGAR